MVRWLEKLGFEDVLRYQTKYVSDQTFGNSEDRYIINTWCGGEVVNASVCKTDIRGSDSRPHLNISKAQHWLRFCLKRRITSKWFPLYLRNITIFFALQLQSIQQVNHIGPCLITLAGVINLFGDNLP